MSHQVELKHILSDYFNDRSSTINQEASILKESVFDVPVKPAACSWEVYDSPERFSRTYTFQDRKRLYDFVNDLLMFEDNFGHHGAHRIEGKEVTVEVYTHEINRITELDQEYIKAADMIFRDVLDYAY